MARYFLELAYKGTSFHGWQVQPNAVSVQGVLQDALLKALRHPIDVVGAGRTDTGVHASYYVAHFDVDQPIDDCAFLAHKLNRILPRDIAVFTCTHVADDAHSRFHASWREYEYWVSMEKNPFLDGYAFKPWFVPDFEAMNQACLRLFNHIDFTSFSKLHTDVKTNNCIIYHAQWTKRGTVWVFTIRADRFLRNMVRAVVGTLFDVGQGKMSVDDFETVILAKDRGKAGASVPPEALYLVDIAYPENVFVKQHPASMHVL